ncbi:hypothetical protein OSCT_1681 [Oscillochloris trichoides DG-6]|uniref:Uncharacterized protein n=1 Tax=Oscillochloris trichoides DG-6 TaxID=765420 RepID=E1IED0_9CHLR|nr:hypothetical protein [Oscillochloris trichoides]EFO80456.1 hypothetical protein OSCT_1681 [Oscillochloris trichoides DG-6]
MLTYDDLVSGLEDAWRAVGLHEHTFIESVIPMTHDRSFKVELFPEHDEPLTTENIPPWLELGFTWTAVHQLICEGRPLPAEPLDLTWSYTATLGKDLERSDSELVRMFQRAVHSAFARYYPAEAMEMEPVTVEVRRLYQNDGQKLQLESIQLVSMTVSDLFEQWNERDLTGLRTILLIEMQLASAIIANLSDAFTPRGRGGYRSVDAA